MAVSHSTPATMLDAALKTADNLLLSNEQQSERPEPISQDAINNLKSLFPNIEFKEIKPASEGGSKTNTEARELVKALKEWSEANLPDHNIYDIATQIESLFVAVWTEVDEALVALNNFKHVISKRAPDLLIARPEDSHFIWKDGTHVTGLDTAMMYLNRWQDRGGVIGNFNLLPKVRHPLIELSMMKSRLSEITESYSSLTSRADGSISKIIDLLEIALEHLPDDMRRERLLISKAIEIADALCCFAFDEHMRIESQDNISELFDKVA